MAGQEDLLVREVTATARAAGFSGVVRVDRGGAVTEGSFGYADRRCAVPMTTATQLGIASGTKTFTALVVLALVQEGRLSLGTPARSLLGDDLPLIGPGVTVEHLLSHRSGIGDYLDESLYSDIEEFELPVPAQRLSSTAAYLEVLEGHETVSGPDAVFAYNNGAFVVLALLAERATGESFYDLLDRLVCRPAGLTSTAFHRSDELPPGAAVGYLDDGLRTNVFHLPVRGSGDGGLFTTVADVRALWIAVLDGRVVEPALVEQMRRQRRRDPHARLEHGLGLWLHRDEPVLEMHGYDVGVSFRSLHHAETGTTCTVISSTADGAGAFDELVDRAVRG